MGGSRRDLLLMVVAFSLISLLVVFVPQASAAETAKNGSAAASGATYVGSQVCEGCHQEQAAQFARTVMGKVFANAARTPLEQRGCEACHGPGSEYVKQMESGSVGNVITFRKGAESAAKYSAVCLQCHEKGQRLYWEGGPHESAGLACTNCHYVMKNISPKDNFVKKTQLDTCFQCHKLKRAQIQFSSHMPLREGKLVCSSCHNPHGSQGPHQLWQNTVNDNCYSCHPERRGPFLWEHPPVVENCTICHRPHGSNNPFLLKVREPRLCQQCHNSTRHPSEPYAYNNDTRVLGRGCTQCHAMIHGSNSPSGEFFHR